MASELDSKIAALIVIYNNNLIQLSKYRTTTSNSIMSSRLNVVQKRAAINNLTINYNTQVTFFKNKLAADIQALRVAAAAAVVVVPAVVVPSNKKALLIGCNYLGTKYELKVCINDTNNIKDKLSASYGFTNIKLMTDETVMKPTRQNIINEITGLLANAVSGDTLFILFSGHGTSYKDANNDEIDGMDELFVPLDFNCISDDEMKLILQNNLKTGVKLLALFDSCHSGTMFDLKYQYLDSTNYNNATVNDKSVETIGNVCLISGCMDSQTSADAFINNKSQGAMTWAFLDTLNKSSSLTWNSLITNMRTSLKTSNYGQIPQLSSGKLLDVNQPFSL